MKGVDFMNEFQREKTKQYMEDYGVKGAFIAKSIGISRTMLCQYLHGSKNLGQRNVEKLVKFLSDRGVKI
jgi:predicted transcriptional regulator